MKKKQSLLDEVRHSAPQIDWSRMERELFEDDALERNNSVIPLRNDRRWIVLVGGVVAAAATVLLFAMFSGPTVSKGVSGANASAAPSVFEIADAQWIDFPGQARVRALPHSRFRVVERGERLRLQLIEGGVVASVVHVDGGEPFAVDVLGKRVAVHGTRLAVWIDPVDGLQVAVSEGVAVVGAPVGARTEGVAVKAGSRALLNENDEVSVYDDVQSRSWIEAILAGSDKWVPPAEVFSADQGSPVKSAPSNSVGIQSGSNGAYGVASVERELTALDIRRGTSEVSAILKSCLPPSVSGVEVSFSTSMRLVVERDGGVGALSFDPPLEGRLAGCADERLRGVKFPRSPKATQVYRRLVISSR